MISCIVLILYFSCLPYLINTHVPNMLIVLSSLALNEITQFKQWRFLLEGLTFIKFLNTSSVVILHNRPFRTCMFWVYCSDWSIFESECKILSTCVEQRVSERDKPWVTGDCTSSAFIRSVFLCHCLTHVNLHWLVFPFLKYTSQLVF